MADQDQAGGERTTETRRTTRQTTTVQRMSDRDVRGVDLAEQTREAAFSKMPDRSGSLLDRD